jgi:hypothetical protein
MPHPQLMVTVFWSMVFIRWPNMIFPGPQKITSIIPIEKPWTTWSPTITSITGSLTTVTTNQARYRRLGNICDIYLRLTIDTNGSGATGIRFTIPINSIRATILYGIDSAGFLLQAVGQTTYFDLYKFDNAYPGATGRILTIRGQYRV